MRAICTSADDAHSDQVCQREREWVGERENAHSDEACLRACLRERESGVCVCVCVSERERERERERESLCL